MGRLARPGAARDPDRLDAVERISPGRPDPRRSGFLRRPSRKDPASPPEAQRPACVSARAAGIGSGGWQHPTRTGDDRPGRRPPGSCRPRDPGRPRPGRRGTARKAVSGARVGGGARRNAAPEGTPARGRRPIPHAAGDGRRRRAPCRRGPEGRRSQQDERPLGWAAGRGGGSSPTRRGGPRSPAAGAKGDQRSGGSGHEPRAKGGAGLAPAHRGGAGRR